MALDYGGGTLRRKKIDRSKGNPPAYVPGGSDEGWYEEEASRYDPVAAERLKQRLRDAGLNVPERGIDDVGSEGPGLDVMRRRLGEMSRANPLEENMRNYAEWERWHRRRGQGREEIDREAQDIWDALHPEDKPEWSWINPKAASMQDLLASSMDDRRWVELPGRETSPWGWGDEIQDLPPDRDYRPRMPQLDKRQYEPGPWDYHQNFEPEGGWPEDKEINDDFARRLAELTSPPPPQPAPEEVTSDGSGFMDFGGNWFSDINQFNPIHWGAVALENSRPDPVDPRLSGGLSGGAASLLDLLPYLLVGA